MRTSETCARRAVIGAGLLVAAGLGAEARGAEPNELPPQPGDHFVHMTGPRKGQPVLVEDISVGVTQTQAWPADASGLVRNGRLLNIVILCRLEGDGISTETQAHMADGIVAYSGMCTHQGCPVNAWSTVKSAFVCSCHGSTYDPKNNAEVVAGPAPRSLPFLGLKSDNGMLVVTTGFSGRVGV